jgi:hypothetical protein
MAITILPADSAVRAGISDWLLHVANNTLHNSYNNINVETELMPPSGVRVHGEGRGLVKVLIVYGMAVDDCACRWQSASRSDSLLLLEGLGRQRNHSEAP